MESKKIPNVLTEVSKFFSSKLIAHGNTPLGVEWNGEESQVVRFDQITKIINRKGAFTVNDLGCGYGALYDYLIKRFKDFDYFGYDISELMINASRNRHDRIGNAEYFVGSQPSRVADYGVASGIFNLRLGCGKLQWENYIKKTLDDLDHTSRRGFAFNCLTSYSDPEKMRDDLYYADPCKLFDHCKRIYSRNVALLHDYGLYDFTILVRKDI